MVTLCLFSAALLLAWLTCRKLFQAARIRAVVVHAHQALARWIARRAEARGDRALAEGVLLRTQQLDADMLGCDCISAEAGAGYGCRQYLRTGGVVCVCPCHGSTRGLDAILWFQVARLGTDDRELPRWQRDAALAALAQVGFEQLGRRAPQAIATRANLAPADARCALRDLHRADALRPRRAPSTAAAAPCPRDFPVQPAQRPANANDGLPAVLGALADEAAGPPSSVGYQVSADMVERALVALARIGQKETGKDLVFRVAAEANLAPRQASRAILALERQGVLSPIPRLRLTGESGPASTPAPATKRGEDAPAGVAPSSKPEAAEVADTAETTVMQRPPMFYGAGHPVDGPTGGAA